MIIKMILTNGFDPDPRVYKEAISLTELGHSVEILCWDRDGSHKDKPVEEIEGILVKRFFGYSEYGSGYKQISKLFNFRKEVFQYLKNEKFDVLHCHDFDGLFIGNYIKKKLKCKLVFDEHDLFYLYFLNREGFLNKLIGLSIKACQKILLKDVDKHIVVTEMMKDIYNDNNTYVINNAPQKDTFKNISKTLSSKVRIGYIGSVRYYDELKTLIDVSKEFSSEIEIIINGRGIVYERLLDYSKGMKHVQLTGKFEPCQLEDLYRNIDVQFAFYPTESSVISMPNKFFESIITETPIIANIRSEFGMSVKKYDIGYALNSEHLKDQVYEVIKMLVENKNELIRIKNNMGKIKEDFYWEANKKRLAEIYDSF